MRKHFIITSAIAMAALMTATGDVDQAAATGALAKLSVNSVVASADVAIAAFSGDVNALADATKRSNAADAAAAEGQEAYSAIERALESGDNDAAEAASGDLESAVSKSGNALAGNFSEEAPRNETPAGVKVSGGPGRPNDVPSIFANASDTALKNSVVKSGNAIAWDVSAFGSRAVVFDDRVTPN